MRRHGWAGTWGSSMWLHGPACGRQGLHVRACRQHGANRARMPRRGVAAARLSAAACRACPPLPQALLYESLETWRSTATEVRAGQRATLARPACRRPSVLHLDSCLQVAQPQVRSESRWLVCISTDSRRLAPPPDTHTGRRTIRSVALCSSTRRPRPWTQRPRGAQPLSSSASPRPSRCAAGGAARAAAQRLRAWVRGGVQGICRARTVREAAAWPAFLPQRSLPCPLLALCARSRRCQRCWLSHWHCCGPSSWPSATLAHGKSGARCAALRVCRQPLGRPRRSM